MTSYYSNLSFEQVLDDLQARFIINIPEEELSSVERICFQIEQAHWYYEDFVREENPTLPSQSLKHFTFLFFQTCPLLSAYVSDQEKAFSDFMEYKVRVPVCGAIIIQEKLDKVLLVRGWKAQASWSFPKGKINKNESEVDCALREVMEEVGFDGSRYILANEYIERTIKEQKVRLYILTGVPESTVFETQTRKEIGDIKWFKLSDCPGYSDVVSQEGKKHKFYLVTAFIPQLKKWMLKYKRAMKRGKGRNGREMAMVSDYKTGSESDSESNLEPLTPVKGKGKKTVSFTEKLPEPVVDSDTESKRLALLSVLKGAPASSPSSNTGSSTNVSTALYAPTTTKNSVKPIVPSPLSEQVKSVKKPREPKPKTSKTQSAVEPPPVRAIPTQILKRAQSAAITTVISESAVNISLNPLLCFKFDVARILAAMDL